MLPDRLQPRPSSTSRTTCGCAVRDAGSQASRGAPGAPGSRRSRWAARSGDRVDRSSHADQNGPRRDDRGDPLTMASREGVDAGRLRGAALLSLALHGSDRPTSVKEIAERTGLPQPYLEQILLAVKGAGLVRVEARCRWRLRAGRPAERDHAGRDPRRRRRPAPADGRAPDHCEGRLRAAGGLGRHVATRPARCSSVHARRASSNAPRRPPRCPARRPRRGALLSMK